MTITEVLPTLGINTELIDRALGNMNQEIIPGEYNSIQVDNICYKSPFDKDSQAIRIYPAIKWTDGGCRPAYGSLDYGVVIYLKKRILPTGDRLFEI